MIAESLAYVSQVVVVLAPTDQFEWVKLQKISKLSAKTLEDRVMVISDTGKGKGEAVRLGAAQVKNDILVFLDADGSHKVSDIPHLTKPIEQQQADLVIASRGRGGSDELHGTVEKMIRLIGSSIITVVINLRYGVELTDSQNGFRAISRVAWQQLLLYSNTFAIEQEMLLQALRRGLRVAEIPSHEFARKYGTSRINLWQMTPHYAWTLLKNLV